VPIYEIRSTGMGAVTLPIPIDPTVKVETRWGRTHGEARVVGSGRFLLVDISNRGNHRCRLLNLKPDGTVEVLQESSGGKFCELCELYDRGWG
jgi:hypothetical protein